MTYQNDVRKLAAGDLVEIDSNLGGTFDMKVMEVTISSVLLKNTHQGWSGDIRRISKYELQTSIDNVISSRELLQSRGAYYG